MFLDVHLMVEKPARYIEAFAQAGADLLSVHLEADHPSRIAEALRIMDRCGVKKAAALRPITKAEAILPYIEELDLVLVMTVEPGFGGQAFMDSQLETIRRVRAIVNQYNPACEVEVDGGITPKTAPLVVEAGANVLVAGSAIYGAADIPAAIAALRGS
jgi:ribulose-phosphate 3-epimerase